MDERIYKETVFIVDALDLDDIIQKEWPGLWSQGLFVAAMESSNDVSHEVAVGPEEAKSWDLEDLARFMSGKEQPWCDTPRLLMNDMCRRGLLEPGLYFVRVCW